MYFAMPILESGIYHFLVLYLGCIMLHNYYTYYNVSIIIIIIITNAERFKFQPKPDSSNHYESI